MDRYSAEIQGAVDRLKAGGRLFLIEQKPYPVPHQVIIVLEGERYPISYNDFVFLLTRNIIHRTGSQVFDEFPAEEYAFTS